MSSADVVQPNFWPKQSPHSFVRSLKNNRNDSPSKHPMQLNHLHFSFSYCDNKCLCYSSVQLRCASFMDSKITFVQVFRKISCTLQSWQFLLRLLLLPPPSPNLPRKCVKCVLVLFYVLISFTFLSLLRTTKEDGTHKFLSIFLCSS